MEYQKLAWEFSLKLSYNEGAAEAGRENPASRRTAIANEPATDDRGRPE